MKSISFIIIFFYFLPFLSFLLQKKKNLLTLTQAKIFSIYLRRIKKCQKDFGIHLHQFYCCFFLYILSCRVLLPVLSLSFCLSMCIYRIYSTLYISLTRSNSFVRSLSLLSSKSFCLRHYHVHSLLFPQREKT